jgi:hypothetical protein
MATRWQSRDVAITLPTETVRAMWDRARRYFDVTEGARFDARSGTTMLLWSSRLDAAGAEPIGAFTVRWDTPTPGEATIHQVAWVPRRGGTEAQVWRAMRVLAGASWPLGTRGRPRSNRAA